MNINFDPQLPYQKIKSLNADFSRKLGQCVDLVEQNNQFFVFKYLDDVADLQLKSAFKHEIAMYLQLQSTGLVLPFLILESAEFRHQSDTNAIILVLPYAHPIDFQKHSIAERITIFINILKRVDDLHDLGFIHGDLKLRHFLNAEPTHDSPIQLIDFAQSQPINSVHSSHLKTVSEMTATPAYMAPEIFHGQAKSVQSDLYALGIIFYEILVGEKPYTVRGQQNSYQQWATAHCQQEIQLLSKGLQKYQECLDHMLAKQQKNRASAIKSVISDLKINENYKIDD